MSSLALMRQRSSPFVEITFPEAVKVEIAGKTKHGVHDDYYTSDECAPGNGGGWGGNSISQGPDDP
jgi:hypothetical protein